MVMDIDDKERLAFLTSLADKVNKEESQDAYVYALADVANVKLRLPDLDGSQKDLASCQKVLDSFDSVETVVHASFYKVNADYYHVRHPSISQQIQENQVGKHTEATSHENIHTNLIPNRLKKNLRPSTKTPFSTWPASTWRNSPKVSVCLAPTTSASQPSFPTPFTTSASSYCTPSWIP